MIALSNTLDREGCRSGGDFREGKLDVSSITFGDFAHFFHLFSQDDSVVHEWCRQNGPLATGFPCQVDHCSGYMDLRPLSRGHGGVVFRCSRNKNHTRVSRIYSFFEKSNLLLQLISNWRISIWPSGQISPWQSNPWDEGNTFSSFNFNCFAF